VYLPQDSFREHLTAYSMQLGSADSAIMHLAENALPHLTLVHVEGSYDAVENWWRRVSTETLEIMRVIHGGRPPDNEMC
jgi:hypothetical protein